MPTSIEEIKALIAFIKRHGMEELPDDVMYVNMSIEEIEALIAFIKGHEREEIPDDVWDVCMRMYEYLDGTFGMKPFERKE